MTDSLDKDIFCSDPGKVTITTTRSTNRLKILKSQPSRTIGDAFIESCHLITTIRVPPPTITYLGALPRTLRRKLR